MAKEILGTGNLGGRRYRSELEIDEPADFVEPHADDEQQGGEGDGDGEESEDDRVRFGSQSRNVLRGLFITRRAETVRGAGNRMRGGSSDRQ